MAATRAHADIAFTQSAKTVDTYDFVEVTVKAKPPGGINPFTEISVTGTFGLAGETAIPVEGFCDADDGSIHRIRFMPSKPGPYNYQVLYRQGDIEQAHTGTFAARKSKRHGLVRIDREHPWHFIYEGTGDHYFWNSTTTYWLLGWRDDSIIRQSIDRLAKLKVNRIRVALSGRTHDGTRWKEPDVKPSDQFQFRLEPWPAARPEDIENPGYDVTRFNLAHFQKCERMLRRARDRNVIVSLIFHLDGRDKGVDPFGKAGMGGPDEQRYYRYVIARFGAFENVMWDVTNEYRLFRDDPWAEKMGALVKQFDPYDHLTSVHGHGTFNFRTSPWADFAMYQSWDEHGGYKFMIANREKQAQLGRPMPQVNEEYGYEDHYPSPWGENRKWPARIADSRRRLAWEMTMAGGYQTTGERANVAGYGGWITGRGNDEMIMLKGYTHLVDFFSRVPWWKLEPRPELVNESTLCLADPGKQYVVYVLAGGSTALKLQPGHYRAQWFNPRTGNYSRLPDVKGAEWKSPEAENNADWVLHLWNAEKP